MSHNRPFWVLSYEWGKSAFDSCERASVNGGARNHRFSQTVNLRWWSKRSRTVTFPTLELYGLIRIVRKLVDYLGIIS